MNLEEHCQHSLKRYGIRGDEIHKWIDEPSRVAGGLHRQFRHDLASLPIVLKIFQEKYGAKLVENLFLDHLKADSETEPFKERYAWSEEEDDFLVKQYNLSIEQLETHFQGRITRKDLVSRRKYLGIVTPKFFRYRSSRFARLSFRLERGQKLFMNIKVISGRNRDVDFCIGKSKGTRRHIHTERHLERFSVEKNIEYTPTYTGTHQFNFGNTFSIWTDKEIEIDFHLENGRTMTFATVI